MKDTFISHSSKDIDIVESLSTMLGAEGVWFDKWELESGDVLIDRIERGIDESRIFLLILSKYSINSNWVRYEGNMALCRYLEDERYRLVIGVLDGVKIPTRFKQFKLCECHSRETAASELFEFMKGIKDDAIGVRRRFVNRTKELQTIENAIDDTSIRFIKVVGFLGIGKRSLIQESVLRFFTHPKLMQIHLSSAHFGSRFTLELCSKAGISIPSDGADSATLYQSNLLAIETLISNGYCLMFTGIESILNDDGIPNDDFLSVLDAFKDHPLLVNHPWFLVSTRWPLISCLDPRTVQELKVDSLESKHLATIIRREIEISAPSAIIDNNDVLVLADKLNGYPLAGRIAAPIVAKFGGVSYLDEKLGAHIIREIKSDVAENIISVVNLSPIEQLLVELLALFSNPLDVEAIAESSNLSVEEVTDAIDNLAQYNLIAIDRFGICLHPLVSDYYYKIGRNHRDLDSCLSKLSLICKNRLKSASTEDSSYVHLLSSTAQLLFYTGKYQEAIGLRRDLLGELRRAAIEMYNRPDYNLSLMYCNEYLSTKQNDKEILYTKARCLSRMGKTSESEELLNSLLKDEQNIRARAKLYRALGRIYMENNVNSEFSQKKAEQYLIMSISTFENESAYQSLGDLMYKVGRYPEAEYYLNKKLNYSPNDPFALSTYADVLWLIGKKGKAIETIAKAIQISPRTANFYFRAARFLQQEGKIQDAYNYFKTAVELDSSYVDAKLSLADVCCDLDLIGEAKRFLSQLNDNSLSKEKRTVKDIITVGILLKENNVDAADKLVSALLLLPHSAVILVRAAQLSLLKGKKFKSSSLNSLAAQEMAKAQAYLDEGLALEPSNRALLGMKDRLNIDNCIL